MLERILRVFKLDRTVFAEVEHDESATSQAAIVVAIVAALSVIGTIIQMLTSLVGGNDLDFGGLLMSIIATLVVTFINWAIWSGVTHLVGTKLFKGEATIGEMLRVIGFAQAPQMLGIIPCIGGMIGGIWSLIAGYFAIKEGLDLDNTGTIVSILVGWLVTVVVRAVVFSVLGIGGLVGISALSGLLSG